MEALASQFVASLARGDADTSLLRRAGEPDPESAAEAFERAASDPDLADSLALRERVLGDGR